MIKVRFVMAWTQWMQKGGDYVPQFDDPDALAAKIGERLNEMIQGALEKGSAYFRQRLIIDMPNLVNESVTSKPLRWCRVLSILRLISVVCLDD